MVTDCKDLAAVIYRDCSVRAMLASLYAVYHSATSLSDTSINCNKLGITDLFQLYFAKYRTSYHTTASSINTHTNTYIQLTLRACNLEKGYLDIISSSLPHCVHLLGVPCSTCQQSCFCSSACHAFATTHPEVHGDQICR